jgi:hypothetical protein
MNKMTTITTTQSCKEVKKKERYEVKQQYFDFNSKGKKPVVEVENKINLSKKPALSTKNKEVKGKVQ